MTWGPGPEKIADLITSTELESVTADEDLAARLLVDRARHLETARSAVDLGDLTGAYQLAYDALRKAAAALLAVQGLRSTSRGDHIAIQDAVQGAVRRRRITVPCLQPDSPQSQLFRVSGLGLRGSGRRGRRGRHQCRRGRAPSCADPRDVWPREPVVTLLRSVVPWLCDISRATVRRHSGTARKGLSAKLIEPARPDDPVTCENVLCPRAELNCRHPL